MGYNGLWPFFRHSGLSFSATWFPEIPWPSAGSPKSVDNRGGRWHIYIYIYIHIYVYIHIHIYIHAHTPIAYACVCIYAIRIHIQVVYEYIYTYEQDASVALSCVHHVTSPRFHRSHKSGWVDTLFGSQPSLDEGAMSCCFSC